MSRLLASLLASIGLLVSVVFFVISIAYPGRQVQEAIVSAGVLLVVLAYGVVKSKRWTIATMLLFGTMAGFFLALKAGSNPVEWLPTLGQFTLPLGVSFCLCFMVLVLRWRIFPWWALIPGLSLIAFSVTLQATAGRFLDILLLVGVAVGMSLMIWGIGEKYLGLIIAGDIVTTVTSGITIAWQYAGLSAPVSQTGIMLAWFSLGWALITISSRVIMDRFLWWPLIPGGVLGMTGMGLYIGENPGGLSRLLTDPILVSIVCFSSYIFFMRLNFRR